MAEHVTIQTLYHQDKKLIASSTFRNIKEWSAANSQEEIYKQRTQ
jgi:hypothetical protein